MRIGADGDDDFDKAKVDAYEEALAQLGKEAGQGGRSETRRKIMIPDGQLSEFSCELMSNTIDVCLALLRNGKLPHYKPELQGR